MSTSVSSINYWANHRGEIAAKAPIICFNLTIPTARTEYSCKCHSLINHLGTTPLSSRHRNTALTRDRLNIANIVTEPPTCERLTIKPTSKHHNLSAPLMHRITTRKGRKTLQWRTPIKNLSKHPPVVWTEETSSISEEDSVPMICKQSTPTMSSLCLPVAVKAQRIKFQGLSHFSQLLTHSVMRLNKISSALEITNRIHRDC